VPLRRALVESEVPIGLNTVGSPWLPVVGALLAEERLPSTPPKTLTMITRTTTAAMNHLFVTDLLGGESGGAPTLLAVPSRYRGGEKITEDGGGLMRELFTGCPRHGLPW